MSKNKTFEEKAAPLFQLRLIFFHPCFKKTIIFPDLDQIGPKVDMLARKYENLSYLQYNENLPVIPKAYASL